MTESIKVKEYFTRAAKEFDDIYDNRGGPIKKLANMLFRKGMRERFDLTLQFCGTGEKSVLDIGCGAGQVYYPPFRTRDEGCGDRLLFRDDSPG